MKTLVVTQKWSGRFSNGKDVLVGEYDYDTFPYPDALPTLLERGLAHVVEIIPVAPPEPAPPPPSAPSAPKRSKR